MSKSIALKSVAVSLVAAAIPWAPHAQAQTTVHIGESFNGTTLSGGTGALSFSETLIAALNIGNIQITAVTPATVEETTGIDPIFGTPTRTGSTATAPITAVTLDGANNVLNVATAGGARMTATPQQNISLGGTLEVKNLAVDIANQRIYASITGNFSGVGTAGGIAPVNNTNITTIDNFYLWNFANISGPTQLNGSGDYRNTITGLSITQSGYQHFVSALRLYSTGASTLTTVTDYGSISSQICTTLAGCPTVPSVPEPSAYALSAVGLLMMAAMVRRRQKS